TEDEVGLDRPALVVLPHVDVRTAHAHGVRRDEHGPRLHGRPGHVAHLDLTGLEAVLDECLHGRRAPCGGCAGGGAGGHRVVSRAGRAREGRPAARRASSWVRTLTAVEPPKYRSRAWRMKSTDSRISPQPLTPSSTLIQPS